MAEYEISPTTPFNWIRLKPELIVDILALLLLFVFLFVLFLVVMVVKVALLRILGIIWWVSNSSLHCPEGVIAYFHDS